VYFGTEVPLIQMDLLSTFQGNIYICIFFADISGSVIFSDGVWGGVAAKALRYKSNGPGIDSRWCHWIFQ
jgi:hypothetical protein